MMKQASLCTPGAILHADVLQPLGLTIAEAARRLGVSRTVLSRVLHGHAGISPDLAVRLERSGVSTARFWMQLQSNDALSQALERTQPVVQALQPHPASA